MTAALLIAAAKAAWRQFYLWATRPPGNEPYAMNFDETTWKVRFVWGKTGQRQVENDAAEYRRRLVLARHYPRR